MRNWKHRFLAGVMTVALLTGLLPVSALAVEDGKITAPLDFTNVGNAEGQTPASGNGYTWSGTAQNGYTLTLNGLDQETSADQDFDFAIKLPTDASNILIIVTGENKINAFNSKKSASGIYYNGNGKVTVTGGGTLEIEAAGSAFVLFSDLIINNVTLSAKCEQGGIQVNSSGDISITNSTITVDSQTLSGAAVNAYGGALTITNSALDITAGNNNGLNAKTTLTISGGETSVTNNSNNKGVPAIAGSNVIMSNGAKVAAVNKSEDGKSYAIGSFVSLTLGENVNISALAHAKSIVAQGTFTMSETATLILPAKTTAEQLTNMKVPSTNNLILGDLPATWDGSVLSFRRTPTGAPVLSTHTITYGDKLNTITLSGSMWDGDTSVPGTFSWDTPDVMPNAGGYSAAWTFTPTDNIQYEMRKGTASITVNKATPTGAPKYTSISSSGKTLADAGLTTEGSTFSVPGTVNWKLVNTTAVEANTNYEWVFIPNDSNNYNNLTGSIELWHRSSGGGGSSSGSSNIITETSKNDDGSTTITVTNKNTGTVTETTKYPDGSSTTVETKKDGTVTTTEKATDGSTHKTVENADGSSKTTIQQADGTKATSTTNTEGKTEAEVNLSNKAVNAAQEDDKTVSLPIPPVSASKDSGDAPVVVVTIPSSSSGEVKVEIPVESATPGTVAVIVDADGTETVVKKSVAGEDGVTLTLDGSTTVKIVDNAKDFVDVPAASWASDAVDYVSAHGIFSGTSENTFSPNIPITRGMVVKVLHNLEGNPVVDYAMDFTDVDPDAYYSEAVRWAASEDIVNGYTDGTFGPDDSINREQLAVIVWRYAGSPATSQSLDCFTDVGEISGYAKEAMEWAVGAGIISGTSGATLSPKGIATRAQVAAILMRFFQNYN